MHNSCMFYGFQKNDPAGGITAWRDQMCHTPRLHRIKARRARTLHNELQNSGLHDTLHHSWHHVSRTNRTYAFKFHVSWAELGRALTGQPTVLRVHRDTHASATLALYTCLCTRMHTALCIGINGILLLFFLLLTLPTVTHRQTGPSRLHAAIISSISVVHIRFHNRLWAYPRSQRDINSFDKIPQFPFE
jgi:hypothetical protein